MDQYVRTGDQAMFRPAFGQAQVFVPPGVMSGTGVSVNIAGPSVCLQGDEKSVVVAGTYLSPPHVIPGACTVTIQALGPDQTSRKTQIMGKPPILKGTMFTAKMSVTAPASYMTPNGTVVNDPVPIYMGQGEFITSNTTVMDGG